MNTLNTLGRRSSITLEDAFQEFLVSQNATGIKEKTLRTYRSHYAAAAKHLDIGSLFYFSKRSMHSQVVVLPILHTRANSKVFHRIRSCFFLRLVQHPESGWLPSLCFILCIIFTSYCILISRPRSAFVKITRPKHTEILQHCTKKQICTLGIDICRIATYTQCININSQPGSWR